MKPIRTIIIDDETPARELLKHYLKEVPQIEVIAECADGFTGLMEIKEKKPALIFLDIQMPRITGFELLEILDDAPEIIFTTAYDQFALKAFEKNAVDYLLKPFPVERLKEAVDKAAARITAGTRESEKISQLASFRDEGSEPINRIVLRKGSTIKILSLESIHYFEAQDDYVMVYHNEGKGLKQQTMKYFEENLPKSMFTRIHRSFIVNIEQISKLEPYGKDNHVVVLKDGKKIQVSRSGYKTLRELLKF